MFCPNFGKYNMHKTLNKLYQMKDEIKPINLIYFFLYFAKLKLIKIIAKYIYVLAECTVTFRAFQYVMGFYMTVQY